MQRRLVWIVAGVLIGALSGALLLHQSAHGQTRVAAKRQITTLVGTGAKGVSGDGGAARQAQINNPFGVVRGPDAAIYFCDTANHRVRKVSAAGLISTVAGNGQRGYSGDGGPALEAQLNEPYEVRFDSAGNLFFVEMQIGRAHV